MRSHRWNRIGVVAVSLTTAVVLAACSSSGGGNKPGSSTGSSGGSTGSPASGAPIVIGWTTIENDLGADFGAQKKLIQDYATNLNASGGIEGRPLKIVTCGQKYASGGAQCANQFLQQNVQAVLGFSPTDDAAMYPILKSANVVYWGAGASPSTAAGLTPDGNHFFIDPGALGMYQATDKFLGESLHPKLVGAIVGSSASAQQAAAAFVKQPLAQYQIPVKLVSISESNPDFTAALNTLSQADFIVTLTNCVQTDAIFNQAAKLGLKAQGLANQCTSAHDIQAMGAGANGLYAINWAVPVDDQRYAGRADVQQYLALSAKYGWDHSEYSEEAYSQIDSIVGFIKQVGVQNLTPAALGQAIANSTDAPMPLGSTAGFDCKNPPAKIAPTACNGSGVVSRISSDGKTTAVDGQFISP